MSVSVCVHVHVHVRAPRNHFVQGGKPLACDYEKDIHIFMSSTDSLSETLRKVKREREWEREKQMGRERFT